MTTKNPLKVAVLGATGQCGSCVIDELLYRGHTVVGMSRNPPKQWNGSNSGNGSYTALSVDIGNAKELRDAFSGKFDSIICAYSAPLKDLSALYETGVEGHGKIKTAMLQSEHGGTFIIIGSS
jgi:putative NADH-flavin reductase